MEANFIILHDVISCLALPQTRTELRGADGGGSDSSSDSDLGASVGKAGNASMTPGNPWSLAVGHDGASSFNYLGSFFVTRWALQCR